MLKRANTFFLGGIKKSSVCNMPLIYPEKPALYHLPEVGGLAQNFLDQ